MATECRVQTKLMDHPLPVAPIEASETSHMEAIEDNDGRMLVFTIGSDKKVYLTSEENHHITSFKQVNLLKGVGDYYAATCLSAFADARGNPHLLVGITNTQEDAPNCVEFLWFNNFNIDEDNTVQPWQHWQEGTKSPTEITHITGAWPKTYSPTQPGVAVLACGSNDKNTDLKTIDLYIDSNHNNSSRSLKLKEHNEDGGKKKVLDLKMGRVNGDTVIYARLRFKPKNSRERGFLTYYNIGASKPDMEPVLIGGDVQDMGDDAHGKCKTSRHGIDAFCPVENEQGDTDLFVAVGDRDLRKLSSRHQFYTPGSRQFYQNSTIVVQNAFNMGDFNTCSHISVTRRDDGKTKVWVITKPDYGPAFDCPALFVFTLMPGGNEDRREDWYGPKNCNYFRQKDVEHLKAFHGSHGDNAICYLSTAGELYHSWESPDTGLWEKHRIEMTDLDKVQDATAFITTVSFIEQIYNEEKLPVASQPARDIQVGIKASQLCSVYVNHEHVYLSADEEKQFSCDAAGRITIIQRANSTLTSPIFSISCPSCIVDDCVMVVDPNESVKGKLADIAANSANLTEFKNNLGDSSLADLPDNELEPVYQVLYHLHKVNESHQANKRVSQRTMDGFGLRHLDFQLDGSINEKTNSMATYFASSSHAPDVLQVSKEVNLKFGITMENGKFQFLDASHPDVTRISDNIRLKHTDSKRSGVGQFLNSLLDIIENAIETLPGGTWVVHIADGVVRFIIDEIDYICDSINTFFRAIALFCKDVWDKITEFLSFILDFNAYIETANTLQSLIIDSAEVLPENAERVFGDFKNKFDKVVESFGEADTGPSDSTPGLSGIGSVLSSASSAASIDPMDLILGNPAIGGLLNSIAGALEGLFPDLDSLAPDEDALYDGFADKPETDLTELIEVVIGQITDIENANLHDIVSTILATMKDSVDESLTLSGTSIQASTRLFVDLATFKVKLKLFEKIFGESISVSLLGIYCILLAIPVRLILAATQETITQEDIKNIISLLQGVAQQNTDSIVNKQGNTGRPHGNTNIVSDDFIKIYIDQYSLLANVASTLDVALTIILDFFGEKVDKINKDREPKIINYPKICRRIANVFYGITSRACTLPIQNSSHPDPDFIQDVKWGLYFSQFLCDCFKIFTCGYVYEWKNKDWENKYKAIVSIASFVSNLTFLMCSIIFMILELKKLIEDTTNKDFAPLCAAYTIYGVSDVVHGVTGMVHDIKKVHDLGLARMSEQSGGKDALAKLEKALLIAEGALSVFEIVVWCYLRKENISLNQTGGEYLEAPSQLSLRSVG